MGCQLLILPSPFFCSSPFETRPELSVISYLKLHLHQTSSICFLYTASGFEGKEVRWEDGDILMKLRGLDCVLNINFPSMLLKVDQNL
ncbi:hypothetical protein GDO81_004525 [Engystomops pustulosus]|uniref:Uncharacterized protein n=1 Tax=Engystomops pustulosus TaxID=76066 RepID=A0AAV6ZWM3_ENGPU|nr:hypothetical protein GDO81_004525 [Engystomops pustulosus]